MICHNQNRPACHIKMGMWVRLIPFFQVDYFLLMSGPISGLKMRRYPLVNFHLGWFTKKDPHKSPKNSVFPTFYGDLWGPFLGDQPKWKISNILILCVNWFHHIIQSSDDTAGIVRTISWFSLYYISAQVSYLISTLTRVPSPTSQSVGSSLQFLPRHHQSSVQSGSSLTCSQCRAFWGSSGIRATISLRFH